METSKPTPELHPEVAQAIEEAVGELRDKLMIQLASAGTGSQDPSQPESDPDDRLARLEQAVETIDASPNQAELLGALLQKAGDFGDRALFLVLEDEQLEGWAGYGFEAGQTEVTEVVIALPDEIALKKPTERGEIGADICVQAGVAAAASGILVPFVLRGHAAGALYVDRLPAGSALDRPALRVLTYVAAQALETLPLRVSTHGDVEVEAQPAAEALAQEPVGAPEVDVNDLIQEVDHETALTEDEDIVAIRREVTPPAFEAAIEDRDELGAESSSDALEGEPATGGASEAVPEPGESFATQDISTMERPPAQEVSDAERTSPIRAMPQVEVEPPSDVEGPGWAFSETPPASDDNRHEEARRLARLLVTEIKLYNEEKVREARASGNIYDQLRDDIERSRRIYDERIDGEVRADTDYFHEEVERILAGGDGAALGN